MFTNNCRDEVTLIFLKHKYVANVARLQYCDPRDVLQLQYENQAIRKTFEEVRERNKWAIQAGTYDAVVEQCDEFFKSIAAEELTNV